MLIRLQLKTADFQGIPIRIIQGKDHRYLKVRDVYRSNLIFEFMKLVHKAYFRKAKHGYDDLGNKWPDLAESTHKKKPKSPLEKGTYTVEDKLEIGLLTWGQRIRWAKNYQTALQENLDAKIPTRRAKSLALKKAWSIFLKSHPGKIRRDKSRRRITDINIRTGRLISSMAPGSISGDRYIPPKYQTVDLTTTGKLKIRIHIDYFANVQNTRPIFPNNSIQWLFAAHRIAIRKAKPVYNSLKAIYSPRKRKTRIRVRKNPRRNRN